MSEIRLNLIGVCDVDGCLALHSDVANNCPLLADNATGANSGNGNLLGASRTGAES